ncbi:MAG: PIN domain-containing protein [Candidatus Scalindua sp.]
MNIFLVLELSSDIYLEAYALPGIFHSDPADQMIVATARLLNYKIITYDNKITQL